jgi:hypothetical protein
MYKFLFLLVVSFTFIQAGAQVGKPRSALQINTATGYDMQNSGTRGMNYIPLDTLSNSDSGAIAFKNGTFYGKYPKWKPLGKGVKLNDSTIIVGGDTIVIGGVGGRLGIEDVTGIQDRYLNMQGHALQIDSITDLNLITAVAGTSGQLALSNVAKLFSYDNVDVHSITLSPTLMSINGSTSTSPPKIWVQASDSLKVPSPSSIAAWHNDTLKAVSIADLTGLVGGGSGSGLNVYNTDSTLADNRTITQAGRYLRFQDGVDYTQFNGALQTIQPDSAGSYYIIKEIKCPFGGLPAEGILSWYEGIGFNAQAPGRHNYPRMEGWNLAPGGGAMVSGLPAIGNSYEPHYLPDVGSPTLWLMEAHDFYIDPNGTQWRLESTTINTRDSSWNRYHVIPAWSLRSTNHTDYFSLSTANRSDHTSIMELQSGNMTTKVQLIANGTEDAVNFKSVSAGQLQFTDWLNIDFGNGNGYDVTNNIWGVTRFSQGFDIVRATNPYGINFKNSAGGSADASFTVDASTGEVRNYAGGGYYNSLYGGGVEAFRASTTGNMLVGQTTDNADGKLQITGATVYNGTDANALHIKGSNAGRRSIIIDNSDATASASLYVRNNRASFDTYGGMLTGGSSDPNTLFGLSVADRSFLFQAGANGTGLALGTLNNQALYFGTNDTERMRITEAGAITFNTSSNSYTFPAVRPVSGEYLGYNSAGVLGWSTPPAGTSYTFTNGLTESAGTAKLGGTLTEATTITSAVGTRTLTINGATNFADNPYGFIRFTNSGTNSTLSLSNTGGASALNASSTGTAATVIGNTGAVIGGTAGHGASISNTQETPSSSNVPLNTYRYTIANNNVLPIITIGRQTSNVAGGTTGFGGALQWVAQVAGGPTQKEQALISSEWIDPTDGSLDADLRFYTVTNNTSTQKLYIANTGVITISNLAGTGTRMVTADASGNISVDDPVTSFAKVLKGTINWTPGVVAAGSSTSTTITVTGAAVGDPVTVSKKSGQSNGEIYDGQVTAPNTVTLRVHNVSTGSANYSSAADYNVILLKY